MRPKLPDINLPNLNDVLDPYHISNLPKIPEKRSALKTYLGPGYKGFINALLRINPEMLSEELKEAFKSDNLNIHQEHEILERIQDQ